jgi:hypothetical protein
MEIKVAEEKSWSFDVLKSYNEEELEEGKIQEARVQISTIQCFKKKRKKKVQYKRL